MYGNFNLILIKIKIIKKLFSSGILFNVQEISPIK